MNNPNATIILAVYTNRSGNEYIGYGDTPLNAIERLQDNAGENVDSISDVSFFEAKPIIVGLVVLSDYPYRPTQPGGTTLI